MNGRRVRISIVPKWNASRLKIEGRGRGGKKNKSIIRGGRPAGTGNKTIVPRGEIQLGFAAGGARAAEGRAQIFRPGAKSPVPNKCAFSRTSVTFCTSHGKVRNIIVIRVVHDDKFNGIRNNYATSRRQT